MQKPAEKCHQTQTCTQEADAVKLPLLPRLPMQTENNSSSNTSSKLFLYVGSLLLTMLLITGNSRTSLQGIRSFVYGPSNSLALGNFMATEIVLQQEPLRVPLDCTCDEPPSVILGQPTSNSISFKLLSDFPSTVRILWSEVGSETALSTKTFQLNPSEPSDILTLSNLQVSSRYTYQLNYQNSEDCGEYFSAPGFFHTQRYFDEQFNFAVIADTHFSDPGSYQQEVFAATRSNMIQAAHNDPGLDFFVDLGDTFMGGKFEPISSLSSSLYSNVFQQYSPIAGTAPLFLVNGNHDGEIGAFVPHLKSGATAEEIAASLPLTFARLRNKYFLNPSAGGFYSGNKEVKYSSVGELKNYYAWNWGNSFFAVLDPYWYTMTHVRNSPWEWTLGKAQYMWLSQVVELTPAVFKFVFIHQFVGGVFGTARGFDGGGDESFAKYFEWGGLDPLSGLDEFEQRRPGWEHGPIHQMFVKFQVSVVFRGHDHLYHLGQLDGVFYNTLPKTSVGEYSNQNVGWTERGYQPGEVTLTSGHTDVQVTQSQATVSMRSSKTNEILHQFVVPRPTVSS